MAGSLCFGQPHGHWGREDMHRVKAAAGRLGSRFAGVLGAEIEKKIAGVVVTGLVAYIYAKEQHIATCKKNATDLEREYSKELYPQNAFVERLADHCGDRWPEAMFMEPCLTSNEETESVLKAMRDSWTFWKKVKGMYEDPGHTLLHPGEKVPWRHLLGWPLPDDAGFFTGSWLRRGAHYRMLFEPVDIANWYYKNKNVKSGHYADGIEDELKDDNNKRPGRYLFLQQQEARVTGQTPASSLGKAHMLKKLLGDRQWQDVNAARAGGSQAAVASDGAAAA